MKRLVIGVVSDTHGDFMTAYRAVQSMGTIDHLFHCGDYLRDADDLSACVSVPITAVLGNGDVGQIGSWEQIVTYNNNQDRLWITHGHLYGVKSDLDHLVKEAKLRQVNVVVYGHTHVPSIEVIEGIIVMNPGSIRYPATNSPPSYGIIILENNKKPQVNIVYLDGNNSNCYDQER